MSENDDNSDQAYKFHERYIILITFISLLLIKNFIFFLHLMSIAINVITFNDFSSFDVYYISTTFKVNAKLKTLYLSCYFTNHKKYV